MLDLESQALRPLHHVPSPGRTEQRHKFRNTPNAQTVSCIINSLRISIKAIFGSFFDVFEPFILGLI